MQAFDGDGIGVSGKLTQLVHTVLNLHGIETALVPSTAVEQRQWPAKFSHGRQCTIRYSYSVHGARIAESTVHYSQSTAAEHLSKLNQNHMNKGEEPGFFYITYCRDNKLVHGACIAEVTVHYSHSTAAGHLSKLNQNHMG